MEQNIIFGIENPLLDICVDAKDELFEKYKVQPGSTYLAEEHHLPMYDEIMKMEGVEYIAGGAAQNTIRGAQWLLNEPGVTCYVGSVGNDDVSKVLKDTATKAGVNVQYHYTDKDRTGTCAVLIKDKDRALIANISACNHYSLEHFESEEIQKLVDSAKFVFSTGFFLTVPVGPEVLSKIAEKAKQDNKVFVSNLAAPFLFEFFWDKVEKLIEYSDYVICNSHEAGALIKKLGWEEGDIEGAALKLAEFKKNNTQRKRVVIFTQGSEPTVVAVDGEIKKFDVIPTKEEDIVDLNGAGDAFVAGLLAGLAKGVSLEECIRAGSYCAHEVIKRSGPTYPEKIDFKWSE